MYKLILFAILLSTSLSYSQDYNPLVKEGALWVTTYFDDFGVDEYCAFKIESDTMVNNVTYNKVYKSTVEPIEGQQEFRFLDRSLFGLIRESDKQVYFIRYEDYVFLENCPIDEESLIYDFNIEVGDTLSLCNTVMVAGNSVIFSEIQNRVEFNIPSKVFLYSDYDQEYLIEGIGNSKGIFVNATNFLSTGYFLSRLIYYCEDDTDCPFLVSSNDLFEDQEVVIYPNPTQSMLRVTFPDSDNYDYTVMSISGRHLLSGMTNHLSELDLDMSHIESGMYLMQLTKGEQSYVSKFIVSK